MKNKLKKIHKDFVKLAKANYVDEHIIIQHFFFHLVLSFLRHTQCRKRR